jgi:archaellum component FlaC
MITIKKDSPEENLFIGLLKQSGGAFSLVLGNTTDIETFKQEIEEEHGGECVIANDLIEAINETRVTTALKLDGVTTLHDNKDNGTIH